VSKIDRDDPKLEMPTRDSPEPNREKALNENVLPKLHPSKTERDEPRSPTPKSDKAAPRRPNDRNENVEPT
jgi:hypothetical protein